MAIHGARYHGKANRLNSMQGFGMQRNHKMILSSRNIKKTVVMAILVTCYCQKANQAQFPLQQTYTETLVDTCAQVLNIKYPQNYKFKNSAGKVLS